MIPKSVLDAAKAFLCWEVFPDLAIQLVPLQHAVAYYCPPGRDLHAITLFYDPAQRDFSEPLFLLFHEAGHARQWLRMRENGRDRLFCQFMDLDKGQEKASFEAEAWLLGRQLFASFADSHGLGPQVISRLEEYGSRCAKSYEHL